MFLEFLNKSGVAHFFAMLNVNMQTFVFRLFGKEVGKFSFIAFFTLKGLKRLINKKKCGII